MKCLPFYSHFITIFYFFQFTEKVEDIEDTLTNTVKHIEEAEPISAHPNKLRDQIAMNNVSTIWIINLSYSLSRFSEAYDSEKSSRHVLHIYYTI